MAVRTVKQPQNRRRYLWPLLAVVIASVLVAGLYLIFHKTSGSATSSTSVSKVNLSRATPAYNSTNNDRKGSSTPSTTLDNGSSSKPAVSQTTFTAKIVSANVANGSLHVGTLVSGTTTGDCSLTATKIGQPELQLGSSTVKQDMNAFDCGVFNIPTSKFPTSGSWQILLTVTSNGASSTDSVTVSI